MDIKRHLSVELVLDNIFNVIGWISLHEDCLDVVDLNHKVFNCNNYFIKLNSL